MTFVARHALWSDEQKDAAARMRRIVEERNLEVIRLAFPDQHGILRGKTIIAPGMQSTSGTPGEVTGRTGGVAPMPDTQYFRRGDIPPERPNQRMHEPERAAMHPSDGFGEPLAIPSDAQLAPRSSGARTTLIVLGGLVLVGGVVAAVLYLT